jgi:Winged helix-turn helix
LTSEQMAAVVVYRNSPQKHVWRARMILATAEGCGTAEIMRCAGVSKPCVSRWQERFMRQGVAGLLRDKTRKPGLPPLPSALVDRVVELTLGGAAGGGDTLDRPGDGGSERHLAALGAAHLGDARAAAASGTSLQAVARPGFCHQAARRGRALSRPARPQSGAEKSQIQALDRTQPGLPMKKMGNSLGSNYGCQEPS